jgi:heme exporter protein A
MLQASRLECVRGDRKLFSGLSFALKPAEILHLEGANGSGKTSLLRIVLGLAPPESGEVRWRDAPIRSLGEEYRRELAWCGHSIALKDDLSAVENMQAAAAVAGRSMDRGAAFAALRRAGIAAATAELPARSLSQGQQRRVALARLPQSGAKLWALDEPFAALDADGVEWLRGEIEAHAAAGGLAIVTSHQPLPVRAAFSTLKIAAA